MPLHTDSQYEEELQQLRAKVLEMGGLVEQQIGDAVASLIERDSPTAHAVIERDHMVNYLDVAIDEACSRLLALHQPAARDLRFIMTSLRISADLERIGDLAENICERALELNTESPLQPRPEIPEMAEGARAMLRDSLDAFLQSSSDTPRATSDATHDASPRGAPTSRPNSASPIWEATHDASMRGASDLALSVCQRDDRIDDLTTQIFNVMLSGMQQQPEHASRATRVLFVAKYLERVADHATNIAEMVIYLAKGKSIRHVSPLPESV